MKKYDAQFKLQVVKSYLAGEGGAKLLARHWSVPEDKVRTWVLHFQWHGIAGLQPKYSRYSDQFKQQVLAHQDREQLSNRQISAIYDIRNCNQVAVWRRKLQPSDDADADMDDDPRMTDTRDHPPEVFAETSMTTSNPRHLCGRTNGCVRRWRT